jgi:hypothetical protein
LTEEVLNLTRRTEANDADVRVLAGLADLPLAAGRETQLAPQLGEWLTAANELNARMAAAENREITPVTVFRHPGAEEGSDGQH